MFPTVSSTIIPHAQEIRGRRGDSFDLKVQVQDDQDPASKLPLPLGSILRFAVKPDWWQGQEPIPNSEALVIKRSYDPAEIEITNPALGQALIKIRRADTLNFPSTTMNWDLELTRPVESLPVQGTVTTVPGDTTILGVETDFQAACLQPGDIITVEGKAVMVMAVLSSQSLRTDYSAWAGSSGLAYTLDRAQVRTIAGGAWTILGDVVI